MTKPALKKSTAQDEFICLTCPLSACVANSPRCPINSKNGSVDASTYDLVLEMLRERDRLKKLRDDLTIEINRVKKMKSSTASAANKIKADAEIARLKNLLLNATLQGRGLKAKVIAEKLEVPLHLVNNIGRQRHL